ncbi:ultraviolet-B receptor UVR8 isoform X2 [Sorghum bicolor]|uniref:ultraviolet-B receptor UVR8 isoform X2 n=1 Tax=Sorghum bicolor TaxID=4558 RepID=UPI000B4242DF|nr:ultraviolet-B receptor UVR8 isoform X2 [Sorghum bicolor]|eukprot:XP_021317482.1 ultraviolet-B receptor UVR8 isoform X2 [Sorghum bicolor]
MWRATRRCPPLLRWFSSDAAASKAAPRRQRVAALWGNGDYGRLGLGVLESRWSPTVCPFFLARAADPPASLACGGAHTLFLTQSGRVFATGLNDFGQLGVGSSVTHTLEPVEVSGFHERVVEVSAGNHHSCAVTADGKLFVWGRNSGGQLGLGKGKVVSTPTKVDCLTDFRIKMVALGSEHSIAVTEEGEVLSWGAAGSGRLGHGRQSSILGFSLTTSEYTPRLIKNFDGIKIKKIAAGMLHSACIDEKGTLFIFGQKTEKGFGRSNEAFRPNIVEEIPFSEEVACGGYHTCVVTDSGDLYSWGSNENGCLGLGYFIYDLLKNLPTSSYMVCSPEILKSSLFKLPVSKVSCGWKHTAVISGDDIYTWGWGGANGTFFEEGHSSGGQLGHGNDVDYFEPMMVPFGKNARAVHVSCGFNHTGAIYEYSED